MPLSKEQEDLLLKQLEDHKHSKYMVDIILDNGHILKNFIVHPNVLRPDKSIVVNHVIKFLLNNKKLFEKKKVLDMGCGSGIIGVVMGVCGAFRVTFSDLFDNPILNTKENVAQFRLQKKSEVYQGDLFEKIKGEYDLIVFNHPLYPADPMQSVKITTAMLDSGELIKRFLKQAIKYIKKDGKIIMPYSYVAGDINDPAIQGPKFGYKTIEEYRLDSENKKRKIAIYCLFKP